MQEDDVLLSNLHPTSLATWPLLWLLLQSGNFDCRASPETKAESQGHTKCVSTTESKQQQAEASP